MPISDLNRKLAGALDQLVARLPIRNQFCDRDALQLLAIGEGSQLRTAHHRAVVVHQLGKYADQRQPGEPAEIDASLGMPRAHQYAAFLGHQRKHVTRPHEIGGAAIAIGKSTHGVGALFGGNPGGQAVAAIDRHSESRAQRRSIERHHRIEMQPARFLRGKRRANDARRVADDECHLFGRAQACGDKQVALALAIVVIGNDDKLAAREGTYGRADSL